MSSIAYPKGDGQAPWDGVWASTRNIGEKPRGTASGFEVLSMGPWSSFQGSPEEKHRGAPVETTVVGESEDE